MVHVTVTLKETFLLLSILWACITSSLALASAPSLSTAGSRNDIGKTETRLHSSPGFGDIDSQSTKKKTAVVVGGGPGGLAAALVLSNIQAQGTKAHGDVGDENGSFFDRVIVLDEAQKESYDPTRAYFFNINRRGQKFTDAFGIDLSKRGTAVQEFARQNVPSDPNEVFDAQSPFRRPMSEEEKENMGTMYWIPRHELVELITDEINAKNRKNANDIRAEIQFLRGSRCEYIEPTENGLVKIVIADDQSTEVNEKHNYLVADFVVGADGISSNVRRSLEDGRFDPQQWSNAKRPSKRFGLKQYTSPSTGLRIKGLRVSPDFAIPKGGTGSDRTEDIPIDFRYNYGLSSALNGPTNRLPLVILPQKDPYSISARPVNICTEPNHDIWDPNKIRTDDGGKSAKAYFEKAHPRYDWNKVVTEEEWEIFASTKGSRFPPCQYSPSMYVSSKKAEAGVVLVGDALHTFPPDLGQGVNAAFCDAMLLGKSFEEAASSAISTDGEISSFVPEALKSYEATNGPESRALIALARCGAPFQYDQSSILNRFRKTFWAANLALRLLLNKVTFGLSPKPAVLLMMDPTISFRRVMKKANTLTAMLWSSVLMIVLSLVKSRFSL